MKAPISLPTSTVSRNALVLIAAIAGGAALYWLRGILTPLAMAIFLLIMIDGVKRFIERRTPVTAHWAAGAAVILVLLGFLLASQHGFQRKLVSLFPERAARSEAVDVFQRVRGGVEGYLWVQTVTGAMICAAAWLLMRAVGLQNAEFWTFVIFIVGFIPVLGGAIAGLAPPIFALVQFESYWPAVILLGGLQLILFISGNLIQPRMQGDNQNIDPVVVLLALAFWGQIWGVVGMFLSTPLAVMAMAVLSEFKGSRWMAVLLSGDGEPYAEKDPPAPKRGRVNPPQAGGV